jgi:hypothetical protein
MNAFLTRTNRLLEQPMGGTPRVLLVVATLLMVPLYLLPLWNMTMFAPQYPDGLRLHIYSYRLDGGNSGQDIKEINVLNHYIGMHDLAAEDFTEFKWIPFVVGALGLIFLRAAVQGKISDLLDASMLFVYFGLFSLWSFGFKLWSYGHHLAPTAAVKVPPFMPPLIGDKQLANFHVYSYPGSGSYFMLGAALMLALAAFLAWHGSRQQAA